MRQPGRETGGEPLPKVKMEVSGSCRLYISLGWAPGFRFHVCVFHLLTKASTSSERPEESLHGRQSTQVLTFGLSGQCLLCSVETLPLPHLSGNLSPGSRPRWKIRGSSVCSSWVWVVTPETFCPGQKSMPCSERHREQVSVPEPKPTPHRCPTSPASHTSPISGLWCSLGNEHEWGRV